MHTLHHHVVLDLKHKYDKKDLWNVDWITEFESVIVVTIEL